MDTIATQKGFVYLAAVIDLFSRRVIGWHVAETMEQDLTITALKRAMKQRKFPNDVIVHTDRGSQYCADDYRKVLASFKGIASMSRKADPWDNAPMESFFATLKTEGLQDTQFRDSDHVRADAHQYIENVYFHRTRSLMTGPIFFIPLHLWPSTVVLNSFGLTMVASLSPTPFNAGLNPARSAWHTSNLENRGRMVSPKASSEPTAQKF